MCARILVIEDEPALRTLLVGLLTQAGHVVLLAADGREGSATLERQPVDLVITDVFMPNQDGIETITNIRRSNATLPIIAMTGSQYFEPEHFLRLAKVLGAD